MTGTAVDPSPIDAADYALLHCIKEADRPLWKTEIHTHFTETAVTLPGPDTLSLQSVGRRINDLHGEAYLTSKIVSPPELQKDLIIAYTLTDAGMAIMEEKQRALLHDYVSNLNEPVDAADKSVIITLLTNATRLSPALRAFLSECSPEEAQAIASLYYVHERMEETLSAEKMSRLHDLLSQTDTTGDFVALFLDE